MVGIDEEPVEFISTFKLIDCIEESLNENPKAQLIKVDTVGRLVDEWMIYDFSIRKMIKYYSIKRSIAFEYGINIGYMFEDRLYDKWCIMDGWSNQSKWMRKEMFGS